MDTSSRDIACNEAYVFLSVIFVEKCFPHDAAAAIK